MEMYGQEKPPLISLEQIDTPIGMWIGDKDAIADVKDNDYIRGILPNVEEYEIVEGFAHMDFQTFDDYEAEYFRQVVRLL